MVKADYHVQPFYVSTINNWFILTVSYYQLIVVKYDQHTTSVFTPCKIITRNFSLAISGISREFQFLLYLQTTQEGDGSKEVTNLGPTRHVLKHFHTISRKLSIGSLQDDAGNQMGNLR